MSVGRDGSAGAERRRMREKGLVLEGEALWRAKQRNTWIHRLQEQREVIFNRMLSVYVKVALSLFFLLLSYTNVWFNLFKIRGKRDLFIINFCTLNMYFSNEIFSFPV